MNLNDIPEPSEEYLQDFLNQVIAHLIRQGKVLARIVTDIGPRLTSEEESAIKTFEEIE